MRHALREALEVTDIALPSFDDEATLWDDVDPEEAAKRISDAGVQEIAVKSGPAAVALFNEGTLVRVPTPKVSNLCDTTGAGDSFNAGYLAGRLVGMHPLAACKLGQGVAGEVIGHFGAGARALPWSAFKGLLTRRPRKPEAKKRGPLMFIRLAFFEGVMRLGRETDFDRPYCRRETPHALHVEIMREVEADDGAHRLPLVLQIAYPDRTALNEALASPIRARGREAKRRL
jgi:hypothetical protein